MSRKLVCYRKPGQRIIQVKLYVLAPKKLRMSLEIVGYSDERSVIPNKFLLKKSERAYGYSSYFSGSLRH